MARSASFTPGWVALNVFLTLQFVQPYAPHGTFQSSERAGGSSLFPVRHTKKVASRFEILQP
jgi:hypothetical protein